MLGAELLLTRNRGPLLEPRYLDPFAAPYQELAAALIALFDQHQGAPRRQLRRALDQLEGDRTDYRVQRGLVKLLFDEHCEFRLEAPLPPAQLRREVFALSREQHPLASEPSLIFPVSRRHVLEQVALERALPVDALETALYADLPENHLLDRFAPPTPLALLHRYNLALAQTLLFRCERLRLSVARNLPVRYKQLFKFIKLFRLIHDIQGDVDAGYEVQLDGPLSMFRLTQKYGYQMARFLPALLLCTRWKMSASLVGRDGSRREFCLDETGGLVSHYRDQTLYDSLLEQTFAARFGAAQTGGWQLERETEILNLKETVMIPDFAFRHRDGRTALLEIVGFWRPEYLRRKFEKLRQAQRPDLIVAVSRGLNVSAADLAGVPGGVFFFKDRIQPREVVALLEKTAARPAQGA